MARRLKIVFWGCVFAFMLFMFLHYSTVVFQALGEKSITVGGTGSRPTRAYSLNAAPVLYLWHVFIYFLGVFVSASIGCIALKRMPSTKK